MKQIIIRPVLLKHECTSESPALRNTATDDCQLFGFYSRPSKEPLEGWGFGAEVGFQSLAF